MQTADTPMILPSCPRVPPCRVIAARGRQRTRSPGLRLLQSRHDDMRDRGHGALENTAILGFWFFVFLVPLSLGMGVLAGMKEGSWIDRAVSAVCILTTSIPPFASTVLVRPSSSSACMLSGTSLMCRDGFLTGSSLVMPVLVLVLYDFGYIARAELRRCNQSRTTPVPALA